MMIEIQDLEGVQKQMSSLGGPTLKKYILKKYISYVWFHSNSRWGMEHRNKEVIANPDGSVCQLYLKYVWMVLTVCSVYVWINIIEGHLITNLKKISALLHPFSAELLMF